MLPTFVIGLREGLEASLIIGIIAAFLRRQGRRDLLRAVFAGVGIALVLCSAVGVGLDIVSKDLPQKQQEGLETVIGLLAVALVTYMVVWMRRHSRELKDQLEGMAGEAIASGAGRAMVVMAFLAVLREGFETAVFLLATFNESGSGAGAVFGAIAGIVVAVGLGYGIYRGGVTLNLSKFFRATGLVLVLVAGGLLMSALHTAHEAGWLNVGQGTTFDLTWLVRPGSVQSSIFTGMLGIQPQPVVIEVIGWFVYLIPVGLYVARPPHRELSRRGLITAISATATATAAVAVLVATLAPNSTRTEAAGAVAIGNGRGSDPHTVHVTITSAHGCTPDRASVDSGALTVDIANKDATAVTEVELLSGNRIVGEKENLPPGFSGSFSVNVDAGTYTLYCPGASPDKATITAAGATTTAPSDTATLFAQAVPRYAQYVDDQVDGLVEATDQLATSLHGTNLKAAQTAYIRARPYYERIEPVAESFTSGTDDLDAAIDARENDVPAGQFTGFHRIEKGLFSAKSTAGLSSYGDQLLVNVKKLQTLTEGLSYKPFELANGAQELLDEVAASKITGEEERYSRIDLVDVESNVEGSQQAFALLRPGLARIDPALTTTIAQRFTVLEQLIDTYHTTTNPSGLRFYSALTAADKQQLAAAIKAVQEPLSRVASKVAASS
jgi:FTR1 family protein